MPRYKNSVRTDAVFACRCGVLNDKTELELDSLFGIAVPRFYQTPLAWLPPCGGFVFGGVLPVSPS